MKFLVVRLHYKKFKMDKDTTENIIVNATAITVSLSDLETWLRITALVLGIAFTLYKFYIIYNKNK